MDQAPDTKPGNYLAGPFLNDHSAALRYVDEASRIACNFDPRLHFAAFGTARRDLSEPAPIGKLNAALGLPIN